LMYETSVYVCTTKKNKIKKIPAMFFSGIAQQNTLEP